MNNFDAFVKKYNDAVELHNSKCKTILRGYKLIHLGDKERPLIEGTYSLNEDGTIDIDGDFTMTEIYDFNVDVETEQIDWKKNPIFVIDDFPFKFNRISGDFVIKSTHIKNLDMFPRLVEGEVYVYRNRELVSIKGVSGSEIWGKCEIGCKSETIYLPESVGGDLWIDDTEWKEICSDKIAHVGGRFTFYDINCRNPRVAKIKEIIKAKEYQFNERKEFRTSEQN